MQEKLCIITITLVLGCQHYIGNQYQRSTEVWKSRFFKNRIPIQRVHNCMNKFIRTCQFGIHFEIFFWKISRRNLNGIIISIRNSKKNSLLIQTMYLHLWDKNRERGKIEKFILLLTGCLDQEGRWTLVGNTTNFEFDDQLANFPQVMLVEEKHYRKIG